MRWKLKARSSDDRARRDCDRAPARKAQGAGFAACVLVGGLGVQGALPASALAEPVRTCVIPPDVEPAPVVAPPPDEIHRDIQPAAYLLSLNWTPQFCREHGSEPRAAVECQANRFGFTVHGLWPNGPARVHPRYCRDVGTLDVSTLRANLCMTPSPELLQHEWEAHGSCGWATPAAYFAQAHALRDAINVPELKPDTGIMTAGQIRDAFIGLNSTIPRDGLDVEVDKRNRLTEVRVCYDLQLHYAACLSGMGAPDPVTIRIATP